MSRHWTALPNFVDCAVFRPVASVAEKQALREALGIPADALVIGCVAAVKKHHKRIDYLIREFSRLSDVANRWKNEKIEQKEREERKGLGSSAGGGKEKSSLFPPFPSVQIPYLLIAGAGTGDTAELIALAESLIPGRHKILADCSRDRMPGLYRAMDVFVLTSLFEMMPIALLEGLASGLPVITHNHPVMTWMTGARKEFEQKESKEREGIGFAAEGGKEKSSLFPSFPSVQTSSFCGGLAIDMSKEGELAAALGGLTPEWIAEHGRQARERAVSMFSKEAVIGRYVEYYRQVLADEG